MTKHTLSTATITGAFIMGVREGVREFFNGFGQALCIVTGFDDKLTPR